MSEALSSNQTIKGWANAYGLLDAHLTWGEFRKIIGNTYCKVRQIQGKAENARVVHHSLDKGADFVATFLVAGAFR